MIKQEMIDDIVLDGYPFKKYRWRDGGFPSPTYKQIKLFLIKKYGVCYFCQVPVVNHPHILGVGQKPDQATIDHLKPRPWGDKPGRAKHEVVEKVLACFKCNWERNLVNQRGEE